MTSPVRVTVTGAAGQISYSLLFRIAAGEMLGPIQPVILQMLEITPVLEALKGVAMELEDCADVSRAVSALLDAEDPMEGPYQLEISSPGIDRPLMNAEDFQQYMGYDASITLKVTRERRTKLEGLIVGVADKAVKIQAEGKKKIVAVRFSDICEAKLVLTESLIKAAADMDR